MFNLNMFLLQATSALQDSLKKIVEKASAAPDTVQLSPEKISQDIRNFNWEAVSRSLADQFTDFALRVVAAIVLFCVGRFIINKLHTVLRMLLAHRRVERSLSTFLLSFVKISLMFILVVSVIGVLGIETSSFIAIFASAGVAIGMALSGTLQNFAGGVLILLIKPYKVGDYIEFGTNKGVVKEIQIFHTIITTYNNERIIVPNGGLSTGTINNFSAEPFHRVEWRLSIAYGDSIETARSAILEILLSDQRIVKQYVEDSVPVADVSTEEEEAGNADATENISFWKLLFKRGNPKEKVREVMNVRQTLLAAHKVTKDCMPQVALENLDESAVVLVARAWVAVDDYWAVYYSINEEIYRRLPEKGLHFPFPQLDVHLKNK